MIARKTEASGKRGETVANFQLRRTPSSIVSKYGLTTNISFNFSEAKNYTENVLYSIDPGNKFMHYLTVDPKQTLKGLNGSFDYL